MQQPQEAEVRIVRLLAITFLAACDPEPAPKTEEIAAAEPDYTWQLKGRVTPGKSPHPDALPFAGGKDMIAQCGTIRPCAAEHWATDDGQEKTLLRRGDGFYQQDGTAWNARWWTISGILRACLGDPLSIPPTSDPGAYRTLHTGPAGLHWRIHLSGQNPCGLAGSVDLDVKEDKIDLSRLTCGGAPWKKGGRECAKERRAAALEMGSANQKP